MTERMKNPLRRRQIAELLVGVVPSAILFTPFLLLLLMALTIGTVPGFVRGRVSVEHWTGLILLLMGPIGILALISLGILIVRGPERVAQDRPLRVLVVGSGIPALAFSVTLLVHQFSARGSEVVDGQMLWMLSLAATTVVGARYLIYLPRLLPPHLQPSRLLPAGVMSRLRGLREPAAPDRAQPAQAGPQLLPMAEAASERSAQTHPSSQRPASRSARSRARSSRQKPA